MEQCAEVYQSREIGLHHVCCHSLGEVDDFTRVFQLPPRHRCFLTAAHL